MIRKPAQLSLDLLHTEDVKDETFFALAEKNISRRRALPRQLTPLKPLPLALLELIGQPFAAKFMRIPTRR